MNVIRTTLERLAGQKHRQHDGLPTPTPQELKWIDAARPPRTGPDRLGRGIRKAVLLLLVEDQGQITTGKARLLRFPSSSTARVRADLEALVSSGLLTAQGEGPARCYRLAARHEPVEGASL